VIIAPREAFKESDLIKINRLLSNSVFDFKVYNDKQYKGHRIFNSRLVYKVKNKNTPTLFKKSRLVIC
jgi:hypothetical protein